MGLKNRTAIITGATGGLGRVVTRRLAESGAQLVLSGSNTAKLDALASELSLADGCWLPVAADLTEAAAAQRLLDAALAKFGRVDILLHFVGGWMGGKPVTQVPAADVSTMLQQHLWTTFYLAQAFCPHLAANGWGRIVVVSSPSAGTPPANGLPYAVGKSAQEALIATLAEELKGTGVTANVLRVRAIDLKHERESQPSARNASWTTPEEIAEAVLYLCSDAAGVINGARIPLYGSP
jgi:NAD(P)-dependent dehydrogenase (short-subunit alcohol dehydrogenase family)